MSTRSHQPELNYRYQGVQERTEEGVTVTDLLDCRNVLGQTNAVVDAERRVLLDVAQDFRLIEVYEDCVLLDLETVNLQENMVLLVMIHLCF